MTEPIVVTFANYVVDDGDPFDYASEGILARHDGVIVWHESNWDRIDQYLRYHAPAVPVRIEFGEEEVVTYADLA